MILNNHRLSVPGISVQTARGARYNDLSTSGNWTIYDITAVDADAKGYSGAIYDGRYMYFAPNNNGSRHGHVARYDTHADFSTSGSWSIFDVSTVDADAKGFISGVFDGTYIYFAPYHNGAYHGHVARYDTTASFTDSGSWTVYDCTAVDTDAKGFIGCCYDGQYVYFAPYHNGSVLHGHVTRYDTTASFTSSGSWEVYDVTAVDSDSKGFFGAVYVDPYVYMVPLYTGTTYHGHVTRYDTGNTFADSGSWEVFDTNGVDSAARGFSGAVSDGTYIYFVPNYNGSRHGHMARYDTGSSFTSASSWTVYDITAVDANAKGLVGAIFDGRYIICVPYNITGSTWNGHVTAYDTTGSFTSSGSWEVYDIETIDSNAKGYIGGAFDGRFFYMAPDNNGSYHGDIARFDAKMLKRIPNTVTGGNHL